MILFRVKILLKYHMTNIAFFMKRTYKYSMLISHQHLLIGIRWMAQSPPFLCKSD